MRGVLVMSGVLLASSALAYDAAPPHSFAKPTAGGKYVLVMLHSLERPAEKGLKEKYGRSGLYPVNDSAKPAWLCEWRANWEANVFASDDGVFAVRVPDGDPGLRHWLLMNDREIPPKPAGWEDAPALLVYRGGQLVRTLALKDVFDCSRFTDRDCFMGPIVTLDSFHDSEGRVTISAEADGRKQTATIAFRTGAVIERGGGGASVPGPAIIGGGDPPRDETANGRSWSRILIGLGFLVGMIVFGVVAVLVTRRQQARRG